MTEKKSASFSKKGIIIALMVVALVVSGLVLDSKRRAAIELGGQDMTENQQKAAEVLEAVQKHIMLPETDNPTVAAIVDVEALRKQDKFYDAAQNGDYIIISGNRAMLYRPSEDVIVDVVPVSFEKPAEEVEN